MKSLSQWLLLPIALVAGFAVAAPSWVELVQEAARLETDGRFEAAEEVYEDAVAAIEDAEPEFSPVLIDPLLGLARTYIANSDYPEAEEALHRAQHIIHRNEGVHALRQLEVVEQLVNLHLERDEPFEADRQEHLALYLGERNFGKDSAELLPALDRLRDWYVDTGQYFRARSNLDRAMEIIEAEGGENDPRLLPLLIESARIRRLQQLCCSYRSLERAREIVEANDDISNDARLDVYLALGDAYVASRKEEEAGEAYRHAWEMLGAEEADKRFSEPVPIAQSEDLRQTGLMANPRTRVYKVEREPTILGSATLYKRLTELSEDEKAFLESVPPQRFVVPGEPRTHDLRLLDPRYTTDEKEEARHVIGTPFEFIQEQLTEILPISMRDEERLAELKLELDLTVDEAGRVSDVVVESDNAPNALVRLMREVAFKARFRPRLADGEPVRTEHVKVIQTFDRRRNTDGE